jgi:hypothetical protein
MFQGLADKKRVCMLFLTVVAATMIPTASANPPDCLSYAYTSDQNHKFLLYSNSNLYNQQLYIIHNCDRVSIYVDDMFIQSSDSNFSIPLELGYHNITLDVGNYEYNYTQVNVIASTFNWYNQYEDYLLTLENKEYTNQEVQILTNWVSIGTGLMIFALSIGVYWRLINHYVDRNHVEEII